MPSSCSMFSPSCTPFRLRHQPLPSVPKRWQLKSSTDSNPQHRIGKVQKPWIQHPALTIEVHPSSQAQKKIWQRNSFCSRPTTLEFFVLCKVNHPWAHLDARREPVLTIPLFAERLLGSPKNTTAARNIGQKSLLNVFEIHMFRKFVLAIQSFVSWLKVCYRTWKYFYDIKTSNPKSNVMPKQTILFNFFLGIQMAKMDSKPQTWQFPKHGLVHPASLSHSLVAEASDQRKVWLEPAKHKSRLGMGRKLSKPAKTSQNSICHAVKNGFKRNGLLLILFLR